MKTITTALSIFFMATLCSFAQPKPGNDNQTTKPTKEVKNEDKGTKVNPDKDKKVKKDKTVQRQHAEEKSKGHAYSGKGEGGDKNIVDPDKKDKKDKKDIKGKKESKPKTNTGTKSGTGTK
ncbi:MAG: hypothetical protein PHD97_07755 [Bacteroidales bacterium]|nr:hypothetical protein [Bacteroidales bacterium]